jgi:large subunit ribosomal protein L28
MAKFCEICNKGVSSGNKVSHSNRKAKRIWAPNVQRVRVLEDGAPARKYVCTRCLRSGKVERYV